MQKSSIRNLANRAKISGWYILKIPNAIKVKYRRKKLKHDLHKSYTHKHHFW